MKPATMAENWSTGYVREVEKTPSWWRDDARPWHSGAWTLDLRGDEIADIAFDGVVVVRAIRAAVRDAGWLTVPTTVVATRIGADSIELNLEQVGLGARVTGTVTILTSGPELRVSWRAVSHDAFRTCRIGLVALHPASWAGTAVTIDHTDGTREESAFPRDIRPHQPLMDIRRLTAIRDGIRFELAFTGDVFETEDQRNWTDASFKTYSRPLALPYPYDLPAGEQVDQSITIRADRVKAAAAVHDGPQLLELVAGGTFPEIGVEASTASEPQAASADGGFRVVELDLRTPTWRAALHRAAADGRPLVVHLVVPASDAPLTEAAAALAALAVPSTRVAAFDAVEHVSDAAVISRTRAALARVGLDVTVIGGARSHFTELNRERERISRDVDGYAVTLTPLFHTLDTEQLVESLTMQRVIAAQTASYAAGRPVHVGPVALRPRFNNVATSPERLPTRTDLAEGYGAAFTGATDDRQATPELAAWTIASAAALAVPTTASVSFFETTGPRGIRAADGTPRPVLAAISALAALTGAELLHQPAAAEVWAIGARTAEKTTILVANPTSVDRRVTVRIPGRDTPATIPADSWIRIEG
ncbi:hypothetical protein [Microbacterium sp. ZW T5_56]|uniref:hypothetical protein n=1 Tax=Microbacterium sp. ZW T5_56 TaxID=3378081 RepID=UPI003854586D